jgi:DNA primase
MDYFQQLKPMLQPSREEHYTAIPTVEELHMENKIIIERTYTSFANGLRAAKAQHPRKYLVDRGLDFHRIPVAFCSGQIHHRKEKAFIDELLQVGILKPSKHPANQEQGGYEIFGFYALIFPLKDKEGSIVNFYARRLKVKNNCHQYMNQAGVYPEYPKENTKRLFIADSIINGASLMCANVLDNRDAVMALHRDNKFSAEHLEIIGGLKELEEIVLYVKHGTDKDLLSELMQKFPGVLITSVAMPEGEDANSMLVTYGSSALAQLLNERITGKVTSVAPVLNTPTVFPSNSAKGVLHSANLQHLVFEYQDYKIEIPGGIRLDEFDRMRCMCKVQHIQKEVADNYRFNIDFYNVAMLNSQLRRLSDQWKVSYSELRQAFGILTDKLEAFRLSKNEQASDTTYTLSEEDATLARKYLKHANLMENTIRDIGLSGIIGEEANSMIMYLAFTSRKQSVPLHVISFGPSGTGKTHLQERISELIPDEDKVFVTDMSPKSLYYFRRGELKNKLLLIEDLDGAKDVMYPLRELKSKQKITRTTVVKDSRGKARTMSFTVEGPVCISGCTTQEKVYDDNSNRSILLYVDTTGEQDRKVMDYQKKRSAGKVDEQQEEHIRRFFRHVQKVLQPLKVINPYAEYLDLNDQVFKPRRTMNIYLAFIEAITFYNQYQREVKMNERGEKFIETTVEDIRWANRLLKDVLLRKSDTLNNEERKFFENIKLYLKKEDKKIFRAKELIKSFRMNPMSVSRYIKALESQGFVKQSGGNRKLGYEYEVNVWDDYTELERSVEGLKSILALKAIEKGKVN